MCIVKIQDNLKKLILGLINNILDALLRGGILQMTWANCQFANFFIVTGITEDWQLYWGPCCGHMTSKKCSQISGNLILTL